MSAGLGDTAAATLQMLEQNILCLLTGARTEPYFTSTEQPTKCGDVVLAKNSTRYSHPYASGRGGGLGLHHRTST